MSRNNRAGCQNIRSGLASASGFQVTGKEHDIGTARLERVRLVLLAPAGELAQSSSSAWRVGPL
jgi:hypothetical protein